MKKRIVGIILCYPKSNPQRIKVKGWKVNPYLFIHKPIGWNGKPARGNEVTLTHIPTGYAILSHILLNRELTIRRLKIIADRWFPSWICKGIGKKRRITEETRICWKGLKDEINFYQNKEAPRWRV